MRIVKLALTVFLTGGEVTIIFLLYNVKRNVALYSKASMILFKHSKDLKSYLEGISRKNIITGFVPTMGALHGGHLSLITKSKQQNHLTICSIFVNPVQFNNKNDFKNYPSAIEEDILLLEESGCDIVFMPDENEIYPDDASKSRHYELGYLETILEGKFRPGHFQGVCLVVEKLLDIVNPRYLYLGQKDYQQCLVIKRLINILGKRIEVVICPIIREANGLAMSSRNLRLNAEEINIASSLHKVLLDIKNNINAANFAELKAHAIKFLEQKGFKMDYLELADKADLRIAAEWQDHKNYILLIAAFLGEVRLIDNLFLKN